MQLSFNQGVAGSRPVRPTSFSSPPLPYLLSRFLESRRQGTSPRTIEFYQATLTPFVRSCSLIHTDINCYLSELTCRNGKNAYYRAIRAFCNWLYRQGYIKDNPITKVDPPKMTRIILPSLTSEQVAYLCEQADNIRDKCIISLFADSEIRLNELLNIKSAHIDWETNTVMIWGKGGKQRKAPFTKRTTDMLKQVLVNTNGHANIGLKFDTYVLSTSCHAPCNKILSVVSMIQTFLFPRSTF